MLKKLVLIILVLLCLLSVAGGKLYWDKRLQQVAHASSLDASETASAAALANDVSNLKIIRQIHRLPKEMQPAALAAYKKNGQVQIAMIGDRQVQVYAQLLQNSFDATFGQFFFKVTPLSLNQTTSLQLNQLQPGNLLQSMPAKPDAVFYVPLIYNDDHQVSTDDTKAVMLALKDKLAKADPKAPFYVVLPNGSTKLAYMSARISGVAQYAEAQKLTVLDGFAKLPTGKQLGNLLEADGVTLNQAGRTVWADNIDQLLGLMKP
ncbi:MAG: SGNH/GDSL hydrolase family protein [Sporolactobacillus sp.]